jgi:hypothetical protein
MSINNLSAEQLRRAAQIKDQIEELYSELSKISDSTTSLPEAPKKRGPRRMSASARARIAAAQRARWAKQKGETVSVAAPKKARRRRMSAEARAKIAAAAKARWAKAKASGKKRL